MKEAASADCRAMLAHISAYLDGELAATECRAIDAHRARCPECDLVVQGLQQTIGLCREAAAAPLPEPVRQRALASIRALLREADEDRTDPLEPPAPRT